MAQVGLKRFVSHSFLSPKTFSFFRKLCPPLISYVSELFDTWSENPYHSNHVGVKYKDIAEM